MTPPSIRAKAAGRHAPSGGRAQDMAALTLVLVASAACATPSGPDGAFEDVRFERRANLPAILTLMPDSVSARETYDGMVQELGEDFDIVPYLVTFDTDPSRLVQAVREQRPRALVIMNNPTLRLYRRYRVLAPPEQRSIPAVAVLTSFLRETGRGLDNLTGVIYEVPLVTSLVNLRALLDQPLRRVGVLHRPVFEKFLEEQRSLIRSEGFELVGVEVAGESGDEIREGLRKLTGEERVDALWVLNDNVLLGRDLLVKGWLPALRRNRTPVVVNVRSLLSEEVSFGTFAVLPDHRALGVQTAQLIASVAARDWRLDFPGEFEYPIAVKKVLDARFARRHLELKEQQLVTVDQILE